MFRKGIPVSRPLPQKDGQFVHTVIAPEGLRHIVLFTFAAGKEPNYESDVEARAFNYGKAVARIHNAVRDFTSDHSRYHLNQDHLIDAPMKSIRPMLLHRPDDWRYLQRLADRMHERLGKMAPENLEQGFCHGDFHGGNANFADDGTVTFFDFDCCGWGWRAYDIAVFRWGARGGGKEKERWEPFLRGYTEERTLPDADLQAVPLFMGIRHIWLLGLHTGNGRDWGFGWMNDGYFDWQIKFLKEWEADYFADGGDAS